MDKQRNSWWVKWKDRESLDNMNQPGVSFLTKSNEDLSGEEFYMRKEIIYIGMTNSKRGLRGRLRQFRQPMRAEKNRHGGGDRVKFKYPDKDEFFKSLYVSVCPFVLTEDHEAPSSYRIQGECAKHELVSIASYLENFGVLPEFNDQNRSPKK